MTGALQDRIVPEEESDEKRFCCVRDTSGGEPSCLHNQRRTPTVVTSTQFDDDEVFVAVARAMLYHFEHEKMSERETIFTILPQKEDVRAFLEALEMKYASVLHSDEYKEDLATLEMSEIVHQTWSIFLPTLRTVWKESESFGYMPSKVFVVPLDEPMAEMDSDEECYRKPPMTPKNFCLSPITCPNRLDSDAIMEVHEAYLPTTSKRPRRSFFAETQSDSIGKVSGEASGMNPFAPGKKFPEFRFEIGRKQTVTNIFASAKRSNSIVDFGFGTAFASSKPVQSLHLDGFDSMGGFYMPPTSPIRTVSNDLNIDR
ncbi:hypothetical protein IV203_028811 [Nitzschia inconspicua]|uniref:Uncharacterized protein n=1 Tax=Nitzschia inconspicua TaxID=303405 RepID=A0A9K3LSF0_9STRA|nr:hypothetical protein IV203_028811 [Nitzschia inconspicua]